MTDEQYEIWLNDTTSTRLLLAELGVYSGGVETTRYLSTGAYVTGSAETPPNQFYDPIMEKSLTVSQQLQVDGTGSGLSIGDVEINNASGDYDSWLEDIFRGRPLRLFLGSPEWPRADFREVFRGTMAGISPKSRKAHGIKLRDKVEQLRGALSTGKIGGSGTNQNVPVPHCFGECFNVSPPLVSGVTYRVHGGPVEAIMEVRDGGLPVSFTADLAAGTFTLVRAPVGAITCDVQGDKFGGVYRNTVASLVQRIVTGYGKVADRFTNDDLDLVSLAAFDAAHPQPVGIWLPDRIDVINACKELANSLAAQISMSQEGKLRLLQLSTPGGGVVHDVYDYHIVSKDLAPTTSTELVSGVKIGFNKNWTVQENLEVAAPAATKDTLATEWLTEDAVDNTVSLLHKISTETIQQDTMLLKRTDAAAEALRRLNLRKEQRQVYQLSAYGSLFEVQLGDTLRLHSARFGLSEGVQGAVVSLATSWAKNRVIVGVLI